MLQLIRKTANSTWFPEIACIKSIRDVTPCLEGAVGPGDVTMTFGGWELIDKVAGFTVAYYQQSEEPPA